MRRHDELVDRLLGEGIPHRGHGPSLVDVAVRRDPGLAERRDHPVEPSACGRAARVAIDDVARAWVAHGCDHQRADRPLGRARANGVDELLAREGLVRDDQHALCTFLLAEMLAHACVSWSVPPLRTTCLAPGTPYSYGLPTTCGISSKLKTGGGEETCHSIVIAFQGFDPAIGPRAQLVIML